MSQENKFIRNVIRSRRDSSAIHATLLIRCRMSSSDPLTRPRPKPAESQNAGEVLITRARRGWRSFARGWAKLASPRTPGRFSIAGLFGDPFQPQPSPDIFAFLAFLSSFLFPIVPSYSCELSCGFFVLSKRQLSQPGSRSLVGVLFTLHRDPRITWGEIFVFDRLNSSEPTRETQPRDREPRLTSRLEVCRCSRRYSVISRYWRTSAQVYSADEKIDWFDKW